MTEKPTNEELKQRVKELEKEAVERKKAEEALRKAHGELEQQVEERTAVLSKANEQLKQEIKERKQVEEALRESEERYRLLVERMSDGLAVRDENDLFAYLNDRMLEMLGYLKDEMLGRPVTDFLDEVNQRVHREQMVKRKKGERSQYEIEWTRKDGRKITTIMSPKPLFDAVSGNFKGSFVVITDITERKRAEEALRESEERYKDFIENALVGVYQVTKKGEFNWANERMAEFLGYNSTEEFLENANAELFFVNQKEKAIILQELDEKGFVLKKEIALKRRDGKQIWVNFNTRRTTTPGGEVLYEGIMEDITEWVCAERALRENEEKLVRSKKMESLGLMAGGIAHDLNNILSGIVSYPDLLLMSLSEDSPLRKPVETMKESGQRAADVVSDLLTLARGAATGKEVLNLNTLVEEYSNSAESMELDKMHPSITLETKLESDLLNINCSPTHVKKSLMNLVANAFEAIGGSGTVTISTANRYLDEPLKGNEALQTGEYAILTVSDDGSGISSEDLERIFEPFYTKKIMGRSGTGLGLAVVWNTVHDHDGYINVKSSEKGTVFELYFPVTRGEVSVAKEKLPPEYYLGNGEKLLVVDDEEGQREIACELLTKLGYSVEAVSSGEEVVEYLKDHSVDLIILDMIMPKGINGQETYEELIKIHPDQKAIIASGFAETEAVRAIQKLGAGQYIQKPYTLEKIGLAVKEELRN